MNTPLDPLQAAHEALRRADARFRAAMRAHDTHEHYGPTARSETAEHERRMARWGDLSLADHIDAPTSAR